MKMKNNRIIKIIMGFLFCNFIDFAVHFYIWGLNYIIIGEITQEILASFNFFYIFCVFLLIKFYQLIFFKGLFIENPWIHIISVCILYIIYIFVCAVITACVIDFGLLLINMIYLNMPIDHPILIFLYVHFSGYHNIIWQVILKNF